MSGESPTEAPGEFEHSELAGRLARVRGAIADAAGAAGRDASELTLIVVTKFHPASLVRDLISLGERSFGESRHPESRDKADAVETLLAEPQGSAQGSSTGLSPAPAIDWHFVGQIQTKKARQIAAYAECLHSVDRSALVDALASAPRSSPLDVFVQLNLTDDPGRGGVDDAGLEPLVERVLEIDSLRLRGLMAVAPLGDDPERAFAAVRERSARVQALAPDASALSMGMSGDFRSAISQGATHLRIGAAITGKRPERP